MRSLCPLIAALMLTGCATETTRSVPTTLPALDQSLATDCREIEPSTALDYDAWQAEDAAILAALADCAIRHRKLVKAWPR